MEIDLNKKDENPGNGERNGPFGRDNLGHSRAGRFLSGLIVVFIGGLLFARQMGALFPSWFFSWPMLLIAIGLITGARHSFRGLGWLVPIVIGALFLADSILPGFSLHQYFWPVMVILLGLVIMFKPRNRWKEKYWEEYRKEHGKHWEARAHKWHRHQWECKHGRGMGSDENYIDATCVFGSIKKNIITKDLKGGDVVCVFGGIELDLTQSEFEGTKVIEITQVFGGTKLIVPANWKVHSEMTIAFAGVEDERANKVQDDEASRILVLRGVCVMGGVSINNF